MKIIGITGGIGSGKSTIARALALHGYTVYDCDCEAKRIIAENEEVRKAIVALLGTESFVDGRYNTSYVAKRVFEDKRLLKALNKIVHPAVKRDIIRQSETVSLLFVESAILYEAGLDEICDTVIEVEAPEDVRIARTIARDYGGDATEENINKVRARIRAQKAISHQSSAIRLTVNNNGQKDIEDIREEILNWLKK